LSPESVLLTFSVTVYGFTVTIRYNDKWVIGAVSKDCELRGSLSAALCQDLHYQ